MLKETSANCLTEKSFISVFPLKAAFSAESVRQAAFFFYKAALAWCVEACSVFHKQESAWVDMLEGATGVGVAL